MYICPALGASKVNITPPPLAFALPQTFKVYYYHHLATLAVFGPILFTGRLHFFAAAAGLVEATNPLVSGRSLSYG